MSDLAELPLNNWRDPGEALRQVCGLIAAAHLLTTIILGTCKASTPAIGQSYTL